MGFNVLQSRLKTNLFLKILLASIVLTVMSTAVQLYFEFKNRVAGVHSTFQFISDSYTAPITDSLWDVNESNIRLQLKGILKLPNIQFCSVRDHTDTNEMIIAEGNQGAHKDMIQNFDLKIYNQSVGTLVVAASFDGIYKELTKMSSVVLISRGIEVFFIASLVLFIIHHLLLRHFITISEYARQLDINHFDHSLALNRPTNNDELQEVVSAINDMRIRIRAGIEEKRQFQKRLEHSNNVLKAQQETSWEGILIVDGNGNILSCNQRYIDIWKIPLEIIDSGSDERAINHALDMLVDPDQFLARVQYLYTHKKDSSEDIIHFLDGRIIERRSSPIFSLDDTYYGRVWYFRDVTEQFLAEQSLAQEKERLQVTLQSIGDAVIATDPKGRITLMNAVAESLTEWPQHQAIGKPLVNVFKIINEATRLTCDNPFEKVMESGQIVELANHTVLVSKSGKEYLIADSGSPIRDTRGNIIGVVLVFRDVSEKRKTENELLKIEKLESLGVLAGGIAHDFNNFLTSIIGNLSLARLELDPNHPILNRMVSMENAAMRAKDLTQQLLTFSKGGKPIKKTTKVVDLIKDAATFAVRGSKSSCRFQFQEDLPLCEIDEGQISQVIHNLVINADQAMPSGGTIDIIGEKIEIPESNAFKVAGGKYLKITVRDQGIGIRKENLMRIFDPYFSTKQKGSGLGLAVAHSVIENHDGRLVAESTPGAGTKIILYLPASTVAVEKRLEPRPPILQGSGRILIMDDDESILEMATAMISTMGYEVDISHNGDEAIKLFKKAQIEKSPYKAVILDLTIPGGKGGIETIAALREMDNNIKAIVSSGYATDQVISKYKEYGFSKAVQKPYRIEEMAEALRLL